MAAILFVVGNLTLTAGNQALYDKMVALGHTVTTRSHTNADKTATGFDAIVIASDTSSGNVTAFLTLAKPIMVTQHAITDDALMWTGGSFMSTNTTETQFQLVGTHAINVNSGLSGTKTGFAVAGPTWRYLVDTNMIAAATVLGRLPSVSSTSVAAWAIDAGATLSDGTTTAPGKRLYMPPLSESAASASADLLTWWGAGINWLVGVAPTPPAAPTGLTTSVTDDDVTLDWDDTATATSYKVYRDTVSGFTPGAGNLVASGVSASTYVDSNRPNATYYYKVVANNSAGDSAASSEASAAVNYVPDVTVIATVDLSTTITLTSNVTQGNPPYTYSFTQTSGPAVTLTGSGASRSFVTPSPWTTNIVIDVLVTDADGDTDLDTVTITPSGGTVTAADPVEPLMFDGTAWV